MVGLLFGEGGKVLFENDGRALEDEETSVFGSVVVPVRLEEWLEI